MQRWKTLIWNKYIVSPQEEWLLRIISLSCNEGVVRVTSPPPTADVSLEALRLLRDWWQQNFPGQSFEEQNADEPD